MNPPPATSPLRRAPSPWMLPTCQARERTSALAGISLAFVTALAICLLAWNSFGSGGGGSGGGFGTGTGSGIGPGSGSGSGGGDGSGVAGGGAGGDMPSMSDSSPQPGSVAQAASTPIEPPPLGFTLPDEPAQVETPKPAVASEQPASSGNGPGSGGGNGGGDGSGTGGGGGSKGGGTEFMGVKTKATRVVFVIDFSGSMAGERLTHTKLELRRSIERLPEEGAFSVIFFSSGATPMPPGGLVSATAKNKKDALEWIRTQHGGGGTDPTDAMERALTEPRPDAIFLMTDGIFGPGPVFEVIDRLNADRKVVINTIAFYEKEAEQTLMRIASENHGDYTYIAPPGSAKP